MLSPILAVLAVAALGLWLLLPGGALRAQDAAIEYAENGTVPVATYTATDPEGRKVYWSLRPSDAPVAAADNGGVEILIADISDAGEFSISADGVLSFNIPPDYEAADDSGTNNTYNIVIVASDDALGVTDRKMAYHKVVVEVMDVDEPGMITLSSLQPQIGVTLTATLMDGDATTGDPLTAIKWEWEKSLDRSSWEPIDGAPIEGAPGSKETVGYLVGGTAEGYYLGATATYTDSHGSKKTSMAVSANTARKAPTTSDADAVFPSGSDARSVDENSPAGTAVGKPVAATDTVDDVLTYSLTGDNGGGFEIDPRTGQITVGSRTVLNTEVMPSYQVTVTVTEASAMATNLPVTIMVDDLNEAPMVTGGVTMLKSAEDDAGNTEDDASMLEGATYTASDPENDDAVVVWSVRGADSTKFSITSDGGLLTFKNAPNYEMPTDAGMNNVYNVTVVATDDGVDDKNKMTAMREVTIMVTNVEEDGTVTLSAQQPKTGVALTASVTDIDGDVTGVTWTWERDDDREDAVTNAGMEEVIKGATSASYTPTKDDISDEFFLRAIASYTDGEGEDTSTATTVAIVVARTDNPPTFPKTETGKRSIDEGMTGDVDAPVQATDKETAQLLTYSLSGADMGSFTITSDTSADNADRGGQISVASGTKLNYEDKATYMVTVTATDPDGLDASIDVTIKVTNVNEAPEIIVGGLAITGPASVSYAEDRSDAVGTYDLAGPDSDSGRWTTLGGADASDFRISNSGVLTFARAPDYENPADDGTDNTYMVTVTATRQRAQHSHAQRGGEGHRRERGCARHR